jgi:hypothetical protein
MPTAPAAKQHVDEKDDDPTWLRGDMPTAPAAKQHVDEKDDDPTWLRGDMPTAPAAKQHVDEKDDDPTWLRGGMSTAPAAKQEERHTKPSVGLEDPGWIHDHQPTASTKKNKEQPATETSADTNGDTMNNAGVDVTTASDLPSNLRDHIRLPEALSKRLSDSTDTSAKDVEQETNMANAGVVHHQDNTEVDELLELKQKYFDVKGRKPAGRYANDEAWLRKHIAAAEKPKAEEQKAKEQEQKRIAELISSEEEEEEQMDVDEPSQRICKICKYEFETFSGKSLCVNCRNLPTTDTEGCSAEDEGKDSQDEAAEGPVTMTLDEYEATAQMERDGGEDDIVAKADRRKSTRRASGRLSTHAPIGLADEPLELSLVRIKLFAAVVILLYIVVRCELVFRLNMIYGWMLRSLEAVTSQHQLLAPLRRHEEKASAVRRCGLLQRLLLQELMSMKMRTYVKIYQQYACQPEKLSAATASNMTRLKKSRNLYQQCEGTGQHQLTQWTAMIQTLL